MDYFPGGSDVRDGKGTVVVFVLGVDDNEDTVGGGGVGGGDAEKGAEGFAGLRGSHCG